MRICPQCETRTPEALCPNDGFRTVAAERPGDPLVGSVFEERYRIEALIGRGGFGAVYRATQLGMDRPVAIKVLKAEFVHDLKEVARFQLEARAIANLHHPGIVLVHDFGASADGRLYLVMELLEGRTLASILRDEAPLDPQRALDLVCQAADALSEAHRAGVVHRDLKPENIYVIDDRRQGERVKLLDFGVAKMVGGAEPSTALTQTGIAIGSPRYMSPEQCQSDPVTGQTDIYSLGCILYEALAGHPVFEADSITAMLVAQVRSPPPPMVRDGQTLGGPLVDLTFRCLAKRPDDRPPGADALVAELTAIARAPGGTGIAPPAARPVEAPLTALAVDDAWNVESPTELAPAVSAETVTAVGSVPASLGGYDVDIPGSRPLAQARPEGPDVATAAAAAASSRRSRTLAAAAEARQHRHGFTREVAPSPMDTLARFRKPLLALGALAVLGVLVFVAVRLLSSPERVDPVHAAAAETLLRRGREALVASERSERLRLRWVELPAGSFLMGDADGDADAQPPHPVELGPFELTRSEITVGQYASCVDEGGCTAALGPEGSDLRAACTWGVEGMLDAPANCLTWKQAAGFCRWVGGRLPTEAEWEYAARGAGGDRRYPWGDAEADCSRARMHGGVTAGCGTGKPAPVCSTRDGDSAQGLCDMAGNVAEWVEDWYVRDFYEHAPKDGRGPASGSARVIRGGGFRQGANNLRTTSRAGLSPDLATDLIGVRCAR
ncbi:MAG: SUMF1/EgtB/PvdO family nonheme iron enzyme [Deltaproteobacteria bacterium]|nr:SUMF1/EgtB/PvdO family nonheme iron enzyme [Deltaproteobacteria bacterium]